MLLLLFLLSLVVRVAIIVHFRPYHDLARYELERTAISLVQTGVYGNPYALPTGPTAHVSPGYTLILAALFRLFGMGTTAEIIKELLASAVTCIAIALLPALAARLSLDRRAGFFAGLIMALYPARPMVEIDGDWEAPYMALALMLIAALATSIWRNRDVDFRRAAIHGLLWGICLLFVSALLPLFAAFVIFDAFWRRNELQRRVGYFALELAVAAACLAPWIIRNEMVLGSPIVTRTNTGIELRISNNASAVADQRVNALNGLFDRYHPLQSPAEAMKVRELGEVEYNRLAMQEAKAWIREHPQRFLGLTLGRIRLFWFYVDPTSRVKTAFLWACSAIGFAGLIVALVNKPMAGIILGTIALVYPIPNYLVHVGLRQSYPVEWLLLLLACSLFTRLVRTQTRVTQFETAASVS
jgi:hypothetical protein